MRREHCGYVYIMASESGTLYTGVTNNLDRRVLEHKTGKNTGFAATYHCTKLVFYECYDNIEVAIRREKEIKAWRREKKEALIKTINTHWRDLSEDIWSNER